LQNLGKDKGIKGTIKMNIQTKRVDTGAQEAQAKVERDKS